MKNEIPNEVKLYLESTRLQLPNYVTKDMKESNNLLYKPFIDYIYKISKSFDVEVSISIVYTDSLKSEAVTINDKHCIIYDRNLGQSINMLNRLFLYEASDKTNNTYFHKLTSQIFSRYGFYNESVFAAQMYQSCKSDMNHQSKQKENGTLIHSKYTHIQEQFIFLHEYSHIIFRKDKKFLVDLNIDIKEWIHTYIEKESNGKNFIKHLTSQNFTKTELDYFNNNLDDMIEYKSTSLNFSKEILNRDDLIEEFCCDKLAILNIVPYITQFGQALNSSDCLKAIILCFLHMRTIQHIELRCSLENNYKFEDRKNKFHINENLYFTFYNMRLHHIKELSFCLFSIEESEQETLYAEITDMMSNHTDKIFTPAENVITNILYNKNLRSDMKEQFDFINKTLDPDQNVKRIVSAILHSMSPS